MSSFYPDPFQSSTTGASLPRLPPSGSPGQNPPPNNGKNIQPSTEQQRRPQTCGRCRINFLPCDGAKPCQLCVQAGQGNHCSYAPSPDFPVYAPLPPPPPAPPVAGPAVASSPPPRRSSNFTTPPRHSPGNGRGSPSGSGSGSVRNGSPNPLRFSPRPGVLIGDSRPLAPAPPAVPRPGPALTPEEAALRERARIRNLALSREAGGEAYYATHPYSGTEWTGDEEDEPEPPEDPGFFTEEMDALETSWAVEDVERERAGKMKQDWEKMKNRGQ